jgi:hypothetical protein
LNVQTGPRARVGWNNLLGVDATMAKIYHKANKIRPDGAVSALCFKMPRAIDLSKASWTNRKEAVTCKKCLEAMGFKQ